MSESISNLIDMIKDIVEDDEKIGAIINIGLDSENEAVREKIIEAWTILMLVHGDLIINELKEIDEGREKETILEKYYPRS